MALFSEFEMDLHDLEYRVRRAPEVRLTVLAQHADRFIDALMKNEKIHIDLPQWRCEAFVREVMTREDVCFRETIADVVLQPTGPLKEGFLEGALRSAQKHMLKRIQEETDRFLISGAVVPEHPACRSITPIRNKEVKVEKKLDRAKLKANRFYVGSRQALEEKVRFVKNAPAVSKAWGHPDLKQAIAHAEELLESSDGQEQFIVKIIKVVRRKPTPVIVEDVK